ncbi:ABC transporter permease [Xenorhabdus sp. DI]|uniref:ABC transporter permease n=1 Tax=Xenorhabdus doucetiae TaxID=351671 RepID=UPI0019BDBEEE|nr:MULTISPECIES: ABC transporter permease [unclassified Xenorhabdus]MBD2783136.1 ABC transporter permease [Xenorhabdus sp. 3]MBD2790269.1 ABC transporter permease [Xenorhabdus sp. DI]MBD2795586.1 ABC transporter permease [Xenorhabdus sp. 18]
MNIKVVWGSFEQGFTQEFSAALHSPVFHWLSWLFPLLLFILTSANFSEGTLFNLPVSVVDNDQSAQSRTFIRNLNAAPHADIKSYNNSLPESIERIRRAQDYALLYIPEDFEKEALSGKQPTISIYYNALFYGAGRYSIQDFSGLMAETNAKYRTIIAAEMGRQLPPLAKATMSYDSLFNASGSYIYFQQFAATIHLLQLFVVTCTIYTMARGKPLLDAESFIGALLGKLAPYTLIFTLLLMVEITALVIFSDAKVAGNPLYMPIVGFFYVIAAQSIGLLLFTFTSSAITAYTMIGMLVSIALAFSGMIVPELSMIWPARVISTLEPLTYALNALFDIFLREVSLQIILHVCLILMIYPAVCSLLIRNRLWQRLNQSEGVA